jgi:hypothetical protein
MEPTPDLARRFWQAVEPLHAVVYFHPDPPAAMARLGLKGFWMAYFAGRFSPMGPVGPAPVNALAFNFAPRRAARALPDAWALSRPEAAATAWTEAGAQVLRDTLRHLDGADSPVAELADLLSAAAAACCCDGRALAAAWQALGATGDDYSRLWWAASVLREHRGDGHVIAAVAHGLRGIDASLTHAAAGTVETATLQQSRGWTDDEWSAARQDLVGRGLLDDTGQLTDAGRDSRQAVEDLTDVLALDPIAHLGTDATERAIALAVPLSRHLVDSSVIRVPNPIGAPRP